jgi:hypothetical protein
MNTLIRYASSAVLLACATAAGATDVGVSISISQPGVYGRIDIGHYPQPVLVQRQPIIIQRGQRALEPVYLWVPPGHQKNWRKHCGRYNACGVPVYFVEDNWYQEHVVRPGRHDHDKPGRGHDKQGKGHDKGNGKGHGKGHD